jgi:hypothetical protein
VGVFHSLVCKKRKVIADLKFNAVLYYNENENESGVAELESERVTFSSKFVPLLKQGVPVKINFLSDNGLVTHIFTGKVFMSGEKFLRIENIVWNLAENAEEYITVKTDLSANIYVPFLEDFEVAKITSLSIDRIKFTSKQIPVEYDQQLYIRITNEPMLPPEMLFILDVLPESLLFGEKAKYVCDIASVSEEFESNLADFIRKTHIEKIERILGVKIK